MIDVSIIVPVYNVEKYITECLKSLINQTYKNIEIIVVNDGSTDNSLSLVNKIDDSRIKIINKENGGLSSARNKGIELAEGKYILFIDSDDFIEDKMAIENMYNMAVNNDLDMVSGDLIWHYSSHKRIIYKNKFIEKSNKIYEGQEIFKLKLKNRCYLAAACINMYKKSIIREIKFKEGIYHEDELFTAKVLLKAQKVGLYKKHFYSYRQREGSIVNQNNNIKRAYDIFNICLELEESFVNINDSELKNLLGNYLTSICMNYIYIYNIIEVDSDILKFIKRYSTNNENKIKYIILKKNVKMFINSFKVIEKIFSVKRYFNSTEIVTRV